MESPLSFNSSENFRKKLLVRNLPPYQVDNVFSNSSIPGSSEYQTNDITPIDTPSVEQIGNQQEQILFPINQYGPQNGTNEYGNTVNINDNLNYKTNEGEYGYTDTIGSDLETIGNETEKQIIIKNVYRPENGVSDFGSTAWYINNDKIINTIGEGEYTIQDTIGSNLETTALSDRPILITNNQYGPENLPTTEVSINNNLQTNANEGEYGFPDSINSPLENKGDVDRPTLISNNQYGPEILPTTEVLINNNLQTNANEGEYGFPDTIDSELQIVGGIDRPTLISNNQYGPENLPTTEVSINSNLQTNANEGEYGFPDTIDSELQIVGEDVRKPNFLQNQWGPEQGQSESEVDPYRKLKSLTIPQGNYDVTDSTGSVLELVGGVKETEAYLSNKYATGDGEYDPTDFNTFQQIALQLPYANSDNTFIFLPSTYTPYSILLSDDPAGSDGSLSQDSDLANIGARQLNKEFKHRVALELLQRTLGQVNVLNSNVDPDTGEISVKPNTDPFDAIGLLTGNIPIVTRIYNITTPDSLFGQGINFAAKLGGLYSPYSYIPGEIFDYPDRIGNGPYTNPLSIIGGAIGSLFSVNQPANQSASELLVEFTSIPTRKILYDQLKYNQYRPNYKIGNNLTAPKGEFYIGERKNHLTSLLSPSNELPYAKDGKTSSMGAVLSYSNMGKLFEGNQLNDTQFGLNSRNFYSAGANKDGVKWIGAGIFGGVTWIGSKDPNKKNFPKAGELQGRGGEQYPDNSEFTFGNLVGYDSTNSTNFDFVPGSLLDVTQKLVDAGQRSSSPLEHVGNAINQVSKVFNDGYQELTKGSRVVRYTTQNSKPDSSAAPTGLEYCRVFTKDRPYYTYDELQKTDGNIRGYTNSVLDKTYNLNIAPVDGYSIKDGRVKKYMLSLENLAWRTSNKKGYTYDDLPACEKGPNGGRIMWFPPYDLSFDESISTSWQDNNFLGRTEPIYTYTNTSRKGNISFKIIVDHPSILNVLVDKELENVGNNGEITQIIDSFFAGCTKYDLWDLVSKFPMFTPNDIFETQILTTEDVITVVGENSYDIPEGEIDIDTQPEPTPTPQPCVVLKYQIGVTTDLVYTGCSGEVITLNALTSGATGEICSKRSDTYNFSNPDPTNIITPTGQNCVQTTPGPTPPPQPTPTPTPTEPPLNIIFPDIGFYYDNNFPIGTDTNEVTVDKDYEHWYGLYIASKTKYTDTGNGSVYSAALNKIFAYGDPTKADKTNYVLTQLSAAGNTQSKYLSDFVDTRKEEIGKFFDFISKEFNEAKTFVGKIGPMLDAGDTITFDLLASASAATNPAYNLNLSKRRLDAVLKWFYKQKTPNQTTLQKYVDQGKLKITQKASGETITIPDGIYASINCRKDFETKKEEGTVSINAMGCRRTAVSNIKRIPGNNQNQNQEQVSTVPLTNNGDSSQTGQQLAGQDFLVIAPTPQEGNNTDIVTQPNITTNPFVKQNPESQPFNNTPNTREQDVQKQTLVKRKDLTKRLARKLLTECNYFEYIKQNEPMIYDGIKSKIKYFQPVFHSLTPEGLNSRLVFLQQCMRPGDTIPTVSQSDNGQQTLLYNDVSNSAFGSPPICVLRLGDFFHTKIAIDQISLKYEDGKFDLNPEGIGVQPMIANVDIGFNFIGAHGLAGPVAQLQNALSFNYYANTEMYDERAESTDNLNLEIYDAQILAQVKDEVGIVNTEAPRPPINDGGVTIGTTITNTINLDNGVTSGTIKYKDIMSGLADSTKQYTEKILTSLEKINENYLIGGLQVFTKDRKYTDGNFNYFGGDVSNTSNIFGYSYDIQSKIESIAEKAKQDVDNGDDCPLLSGLFNQNLPNPQIRKVKKELKNQIDIKKEQMLNDLENFANEINNIQYPLISLIDKISYVSDSHDGFIKKNNSVIVYNLSGTTQVTPPTLPNVNNTLQELIQDSYVVKTNINEFYQKIQDFGLIPTGDDVYRNDFTQNTYITNQNFLPQETVFFILFGKDIIEDSDMFAIDLIDKAIPNLNNDDEILWLKFLDENLNTPTIGLRDSYNASKTLVDKKITDFRTNYFNSTFTNYKPYNLDKERIMWYESQVSSQAPYTDNLSSIYSSTNAQWDKFNLQKSFQ